MPRTKLSIGPRLRLLRTTWGVFKPRSRQELSEASGVPVETIRALETGRRLDPCWSIVQALATALGVSTEDLRTDSEGWV